MLGYPVDPPVLAANSAAVKIREVRAISRKGRKGCIEPMRNPQRLYAGRFVVSQPSSDDKVRTAWRHAERDRNERAAIERWSATE
jgi:hypothetical protein